jgi:hypothetical protein
MIIRRTNLKPLRPVADVGTSAPASTAEEGFRAMQRHAGATRIPITAATPESVAVPVRSTPPGDIIYGARAIARYLFDDDSDRARRRVFNLWNHFRDRKERVGFFKLKGALCLAKSVWQAFHDNG